MLWLMLLKLLAWTDKKKQGDWKISMLSLLTVYKIWTLKHTMQEEFVFSKQAMLITFLISKKDIGTDLYYSAYWWLELFLILSFFRSKHISMRALWWIKRQAWSRLVAFTSLLSWLKILTVGWFVKKQGNSLDCSTFVSTVLALQNLILLMASK